MRRIRPIYAACILLLLVANIIFANTLFNVYLINRYNERSYAQYDTDQIRITYKLESGKEKEVYFSNIAATIKNTEDLSRRERLDILCFVDYCIEKKGYERTRGMRNMEGELVLHIILCKLDYKPESSEHADLEYTGDSRWYVRWGSKAFELLGL